MKKDGSGNAAKTKIPPTPGAINPLRFFYKLMLTPDVMKLRLPEMFTCAFGYELSETCYLTVSSGDTHKLALVQENTSLWLDHGWEEFVNRYSIGYGYFLLFSYTGNSKFTINIFDLSASEISYNQGNNTPVGQHGSSHDSQEMEIDDSDAQSIGSDDWDDDIDLSNLGSDDFDDEHSVWGNAAVANLPLWMMNYEAEIKIVSDAGVSMPRNPFFLASIEPYCLVPGGFLNIPIGFARDNDMHKAGGNIRVEVTGRKTRVLECHRFGFQFTITRGWRDFARNIHLKIRDVCIFELIDAENWVFKLRVVTC